MTRRTRGGEAPPSAGRGRTDRTKRVARRRLAPLFVVCALPLLAHLVSDLVPPRGAGAQAGAQEVVLTKYDLTCKQQTYRLAVVSLTATLQEEQTPASSLGLVLIRVGNRPNRVFNIYHFGPGQSAVTKRDDDEGVFGLKDYDPNHIESNFKKFLAAATGCPGVDALARVMADALKPAGVDGRAAPPNFTAGEFTRVVGETVPEFKNLSPSQQLPPLDAAEGQREFGEAVRQYGDDLKVDNNQLISANREQLLKRVKELSPTPSPTASPGATPADGSAAKEDGRFYLYLGALLALAAAALTTYFNRRRIEPLLKRWGLTGSRGTQADAAATLADILRDSRENFQQVQGRPDFMRREIKRLCVDIDRFRTRYRPPDPDKLRWMAGTISNTLALTENIRAHKAQSLFDQLWTDLDDYQKRHYPIDAARDAGGPVMHGTPGPGETKPDETKPDETAAAPGVVGRATTPAAQTAAVSLDESSLKAIEDRLAPLIESLRSESAGQKQVQQLWQVWFGEGQSPGSDAFKQVLQRTTDARAVFEVLHANFPPGDGSGQADVKARLLGFFGELRRLKNQYIGGHDGELKTPDKILAAFGTKLDAGQQADAQLGRLNEALSNTGRVMRPLLNNGEDVLQAAQRLAREQHGILSLLKDYRADGGLSAESAVGRLFAAAESLKQRVIRARETMSAEVAGDGKVDEMAARVVEELRSAKQLAGQATQLKEERDDFRSRAERAEPEAAAAKELAVTVARRLNFHEGRVEREEKPAVFMVEQMERQPPLYDQLRYMLLASRSMLDEALPALLGSGRGDIAEALRLEGIRKNLADFTGSLHGIEPDKLWELGVYRAFSDGWLHDLFRLTLLLRTYFSGTDELYKLRRAAELAAAVFDSAMHHLGAQLVAVKLLENPPGSVEEEKNAMPSLRALPEVRSRVVEKYREVRDGGFVVDVGAFTVKVNGALMGVGRVFIMNPSDWD